MIRDRLLYVGEYLEQYLFEAVTLEDLASTAAMSVRSLQRHFGGLVGENLAGYVRGRRLTAAARRLSQGHQDILGLALDCQFGSHEAFTRAFRRQFFMSPSEYREQGCLFHNYHRPALGDAMLTELSAQWQQAPEISLKQAQTLWGFIEPIDSEAVTRCGFSGLISRLMGQLTSLWGEAKPQIVLFKQPQPQGKQLCVMVATTAGVGLPPLGCQTICLPAGWQATFTMQGNAQMLPVFLYHCYAQWLFHLGWHHADAPIELHIPGPQSEAPFRFTLPVQSTPCPYYRLW